MVEDTIRRFIAEELSSNSIRESLTDDYPLLERGILDSLGLFQLVGYIESEFGVEVHDEDLIPKHFGTIHDIAALVVLKRS